MNLEKLKKLITPIKVLRIYHQHSVEGIENIPAMGPALVVLNHSLATYDMGLLFEAIYEYNQRIVRPLVDRLFFKVPYLGELVTELGAVVGSPEGAKKLLKEGNLIAVAPGGMMEAIRSSQNRYQICWERRKGFVRLAIDAGCPVLLAACPQADHLYDVYENPLTKWIYEAFKVPFFLASGAFYTALPKPVKLTHYIGTPLYPPPKPSSKKGYDQAVEAFHEEILVAMNDLMKRSSKKLKRLPPKKEARPQTKRRGEKR